METYEEIYERMKSKYIDESGCEFDEASDIAIRLKVLAGEIYNSTVNAQWLKKQMFASSATGQYLDEFAKQRGISRKSAQKSQGEITFYISESTDHSIPIPKGTVVATEDEEPLRFVTTEDEELCSGNTLVSVYAEAEKAGSAGNVAEGKIKIPVSVPSEIESTVNRESFSGGTDEESDEKLRERIKESYTNLSNGTNAAYYEQLALSIDGIYKASAVGKVRGTGTVNVYVSGDGVQATSDMISSVQTLMNESRELNVSVQVLNASQVSCDFDAVIYKKSGYTDEEVKQKCSEAFTEYINSIDIGGKFYLSSLGRCLLATGCVENYSFNTSMEDTEVSQSQCFIVGSVDLEVS